MDIIIAIGILYLFIGLLIGMLFTVLDDAGTGVVMMIFYPIIIPLFIVSLMMIMSLAFLTREQDPERE